MKSSNKPVVFKSMFNGEYTRPGVIKRPAQLSPKQRALRYMGIKEQGLSSLKSKVTPWSAT